MEIEKHNVSSINSNHNISNMANISNQEIYTKEDNSYEAENENLNTSLSSEKFSTPSAKFFLEQQSTIKKQIETPNNQIRQTLFKVNENLNESNNNCVHQNGTCFDLSVANTINSNHTINDNSISNENNITIVQDKNQINLFKTISILEKNYDEVLLINSKLVSSVNNLQDEFEYLIQNKEELINDLILKNNVLQKEKNLALEDIQGLEASFSELHRRFEKLKVSAEMSKKNEELYKNECLTLAEKLQETQKLNEQFKYELQKNEENLNKVLENSKKSSEKEFISLRAQLKKAEMRLNGLQNEIEQKTRENIELNQMIDDLTK